MEELEKLYNAIPSRYNIGKFNEFSAKMSDVNSRKRFYDAMASNGVNLGDYNEYEKRLSSGTSGVKKKVDSQSVPEPKDTMVSTGEESPASPSSSASLPSKAFDIGVESINELDQQEKEPQSPGPMKGDYVSPTTETNTLSGPGVFDPEKFTAQEEPLIKDAMPGLEQGTKQFAEDVSSRADDRAEKAISKGFIGSDRNKDLGETFPNLYEDVLNQIQNDKLFISEYDGLSDEVKEAIAPGLIFENGQVSGLDYTKIPKEAISKIVADYDDGKWWNNILDKSVESLSGKILDQKKVETALQKKEASFLFEKLKNNKDALDALEADTNPESKKEAELTKLEYNNTLAQLKGLEKDLNEESIVMNSLELIQNNTNLPGLVSAGLTLAGTASAYALSLLPALHSQSEGAKFKDAIAIARWKESNPLVLPEGVDQTSKEGVRLRIEHHKDAIRGADLYSEKVMKKSLDIFNSVKDFAPKDFRDSNFNFAGEVGGQLAFQVAMAKVGGASGIPLGMNVASFEAGYSMSRMEMYADAIDAGLHHVDAAKLSDQYALISAPLEMLPIGGYLGKKAEKIGLGQFRKKIVNEIAEKGITNFSKDFASNQVSLSLKPLFIKAGVEFLEEGGQEAAQYNLGLGLAKLYNENKEDSQVEFTKEDFGSDEYWKNMKENFLLGGLAGAGIGGTMSVLNGDVFVGSNYAAMEEMFLDPKQMGKINDQLEAYRKIGKIKTDEDLQIVKERVGIVAKAAAEVDNATKTSKSLSGSDTKRKLFELTTERLSLSKEVEGVETLALVSDKKDRITKIDETISGIVSGKIALKDLEAEQEVAEDTEQIALEEPTTDQLQSDIDNGEVVTIMFTDENEIPDVYKKKTKVENSIRNTGTTKVGRIGEARPTFMVTVEKSLADYYESTKQASTNAEETVESDSQPKKFKVFQGGDGATGYFAAEEGYASRFGEVKESEITAERPLDLNEWSRRYEEAGGEKVLGQPLFIMHSDRVKDNWQVATLQLEQKMGKEVADEFRAELAASDVIIGKDAGNTDMGDVYYVKPKNKTNEDTANTTGDKAGESITATGEAVREGAGDTETEQAVGEVTAEVKADKNTEQVAEQEVTKRELTIFRGQEPRKDTEGRPKTVHKIKKGKFGSDNIKGTDGNKGTKPIKKFTIPVGTTIETVKLPGNTPAATSRVDLETAAIDNSTAQVVKLETIDAGGRETQYIIKDDSLIESGVDMTAEEEASARKPKTEPKKRKSKTQKDIDDFVENKMSSKKDVSISEKEGLKKQIRDFARGMREAYKDQRTFKKKANKLISDNLQLFGNLSPSKVKAFTRRALEIDFSKPGSLDKFIEYAASLEQITEDKLYQDIVSSIKKKTAPSKLKKRKSGVVKGKIANYEGKVLSSIHSAIKEGEIDAIENRIKALKEKENQTGTLSEGETALLESSLISIELLSGNLKTAQDAQKKIDELIDGGKSKYREAVKKRSEEYKRLVDESIPAISGGKEMTDQFGKLEQGSKRRPLTDVIREKLSGFLDWGEGFRTLLDKIDRTANRDESGYGGFLDKELYDPIADGRRKKDNLDTEKVDELSKKLEELYGKRKKKELQKNRESKNLGSFTDRNGNKVNLFLSQNQAYPLYQYMQDPSNMKTFEAMGFTDEMLEAVENFLTPEVKKWADWQMSEFFPKYYNEINAVYKEMNDIDLPRQKIYVPIVRKATELSEKEVGIDQIAFGNPQSTYKSLNQRQNSKTEFDMSKDGNEKLMEYVEGMNTYIAFAKPVKRLNIVFKNRGVRNAIKEFNSKETLQAIDGFIERIANNSSDLGKRIAILDKIRGNVTIASLALAPVVTIKQLTSIPAYASDIPTKKFLSGMGAFARNPKKAADILMKSEYMQKRYKDGFERDILDGMKRDYDGMLRGTSNLKNKMMFLIKWGDKGAILMGGYSVYKYHFDKAIAENKTLNEAKSIALSKFEEATKLSQQSTNPEDISEFQAMGSLGKMFTMYMTSPISYFRQERKSARDFVKGYKANNKKLMKNAVKRFLTYHFVLPIVFQYVANGLPGLLSDWDDEDEKDLKRAASIGSLNGVFIAGQLISFLGDILTDKAWAKGGKFSPSPAIDAVADILFQAGKVANEWSENGHEFSDDLIEEIIDFGFSLDVAIGLPINRVKNLLENWSMISDDNDLETREKIALGVGYSPYVITPGKMKKGGGGSVKVGRTEAQEKKALKEIDPALYKEIYGN